MAFNELKESTDELQVQIQKYVESTASYYKLWGFKVAMKSTVMIFKFALILLCVSMLLIFCSVSAAFAIGSALESNALGFLIIGGVYLLATIILLFIKDTFAEGKILKKFSEIFFND